jgi:D-alanyl-D-alanine dipeptidase
LHRLLPPILALALTGSALARADATARPRGFARLSDVAPSIRQDMRYAGPNNFMGRPAPGYRAPRCWLRREAAAALARVQQDLHAKGQGLIVYDCYRPKRAVEAFYRWAMDPADQAKKPEYYPDIDKSRLFALGYIARQSGHSTGLAVDLGVDGQDFGTPFDFFDPRSNTANAAIPPMAAENRRALVKAMRRRGFENLPGEWWHFSFKAPAAGPGLDAEIR